MSKKTIWLFVVAGLLFVFLALRLPGLSQPYHQDEYKWAEIVAPGSLLAGTIPHPPLSELTYVLTDRLFSNAHLRFTPFIFGLFNLFLIWAVARRRFGARAALLSAGLFAVSFFSVLASLMVDTDGQVLPFYFLLAVLAYDRLGQTVERKKKVLWGLLFALALAAGLLTKLSCLIPVAAFALDWLWQNRRKITRKTLGYGLGALAGCAVLLAAALLNAHHLFPQFNIATAFVYMTRFFNFATRNYFQVLVQVLKAVLYTSPLLLAPLLLIRRKFLAETRLFWFFLGVAMIFYLVLFDFSVGALDRYLQVVIVPLCLIGGLVYDDLLSGLGKKLRWPTIIGATLPAVLLFGLQFLPHFVPPQQPKTEWLVRVATLKWNFLFPFSGGSGPLGFYASFLFMAAAFIVCGLLVLLIRLRPQWQKIFALCLLFVGLGYNLVFDEEYLFGKINGNAAAVLSPVLAFVANNQSIDQVITYNDIGAYELMKMGKYFRRLYVDPAFEASNIKKLNDFKKYYVVVDMPHLNDQSIYAKYFAGCKSVFQTSSGRITGSVYDCREAEF